MLSLGVVGCGGSPNVGGHARIGPEGGLLTSYDGVVTIAILPDALDSTIDFFIEPSTAPPQIYGPAYRVDPNPTLAIAATVTYRFDLPMERAAVVAVDPLDYVEGDARWTLLPRIDVDDRLVKAKDSQVSIFYGLLDDGPRIIEEVDGTTSGGTDGGGVGAGPGGGGGSGNADDNNDDDNDDNGNDDDNDDNDDESTGPGQEIPCPDIFVGPFNAVEFIDMPGPGAEDLGFSPTDGVFSVVASVDLAEPVVYHVTPDAIATAFSDPISLPNDLTTGTRYMAGGDLLVAAYFADWIYRVDNTTGALSVLSDGDAIDGPNQVVPDVMGNVWITSSENSSIVTIDVATGVATTFISGNASVGFANGLVVDWERMLVFWTDYDTGLVRKSAFNNALGPVGPPELIADVGGYPDGMTMDECGYLYVVDEGGNGVGPSRLVRIALDPDGDPIGDPEYMISNFPTNGLANPQFAQGAGWEDYNETLFVSGFPGVIYTIDVQVEGAATVIGEPTPDRRRR